MIIAVGTASGDSRPAVALAASLARKGFQVAIATHPEARELIQGADVTFFDIGMCIGKARADTDEGKQLTTAGACGKMSAAKSFLQPLVRQYGEASLEALRTFNPDAVVLSTLAVWMSLHSAIHVLGSLRNIFVYHMMPMVQSSEMYPCIAMAKPYPVHCKCLCTMVWSLTANTAWPLYRKPLEQALTPAGVQVDSNPMAILPELPQFLLYSPALFSFRPSDWPAKVQVLGSIPALPESGPEARLVEFVQSESEKVLVYFGLGSMLAAVLTPVQQDSVLQAFKRAATLAGVRAIIQCPAGSLQAESSDIFLAHGALPHRWLFPKCSAVVTHGGAGTVHRSLGSGCPVIVIACEAQSDQPFWGEVAVAARVGVAPMAVEKLGDGQKLAGVISQVIDNVGMKLAASELAERMSLEDGSSKLAEHLISL